MPGAPAIPDTPNPMTPVSVSNTAHTLEVATAAWQLSHRLAGTEFVPAALRNKPEAVLACILSGHELGIGPMQSLQKIHVIDGRPAQAAELMRAIVQAHGHEVWFEDMSTTSVTIVGRRDGQTRETRVTWTMDDARKAGLAEKQNWRKYPRSMLMARATGELCRAMFADVLAGISYTMEELTDGEAIDVADLTYRSDRDTGSAAVAADVTAIESPGKSTRTTTRRKKAAPAAPATPQHVPLPGEDDDVVDGEPVETGDFTEADPEDADDDVADAEIVEQRPPESSENDAAGEGDTDTADQFPPDNEPPVDTGARLTPAQSVVIRMEQMGFTDRAVRLTMIGSIVGREVTSTNDLTIDEVRLVHDTLSEDDGAATVTDSANETEGDVDPVDGAEDDGGRSAPPPSSPSGRADPEDMTGDQWRDVLKRRGVKAAELLKKARELAGSNVATLDDIAGRGIGQDLLDFVEDLALSRGK